MKYTGVVCRMPVYDFTIENFVDLCEDRYVEPFGFTIQGKFVDTEGNEEWRSSKVLTK